MKTHALLLAALLSLAGCGQDVCTHNNATTGKCDTVIDGKDGKLWVLAGDNATWVRATGQSNDNPAPTSGVEPSNRIAAAQAGARAEQAALQSNVKDKFYEEECINHVYYITFTNGGATAEYDTDGKVKVCAG